MGKNLLPARQNVPKTRSSNGVTWFMDFAGTRCLDQEDEDHVMNSFLRPSVIETWVSKGYICVIVSAEFKWYRKLQLSKLNWNVFKQWYGGSTFNRRKMTTLKWSKRWRSISPLYYEGILHQTLFFNSSLKKTLPKQMSTTDISVRRLNVKAKFDFQYII